MNVARARVLRAISWDPFVYMGGLFSAFLLFQWLNGGRELIYQTDVRMWTYAASPLGWGPSCVDPATARPFFLAALGMTVSVFGVRHGMSVLARYYLLTGLCLLAGFAAFVEVFASLVPDLARIGWRPTATGEQFFCFTARIQSGAFYSLAAVLSFGVVAESLVRQRRRTAFLVVLAASICLFAIWMTCSAVLVYATLPFLLLGTWIFMREVRRETTAVDRVRVVVVAVLGFSMGVFVAATALPGSAAFRRLFFDPAWLTSVGSFWEQWLMRVQIALSVWLDAPWFGVGPGGYRLFMGQGLDLKQWAALQTPKQAVNCDVLRGLAEFGLTGVVLFAAIVIVLLVAVTVRIIRLRQEDALHAGEEPMRLSALSMCALFACLCVAIEAVFSEPFAAPFVVVPWSLVLACAAFFISKRKKSVKR